MATTEAALQGIRRYGHGWRRQIHLGKSIARVGELVDLQKDCKPVSEEELKKVADDIAFKLRAAHSRANWDKVIKLDAYADAIESAGEHTVDDLVDQLERLYDECDYYRVVVT